MQHNLAGVLRELKPRKALFTTYTFNAAFFEATVLQAAFRPDGCQIHVLIDDGPLAASTIGSYAQHIGSRYAVAPVRAPGGGIFHPKIALLESDDRQVLCVGSGNLTASGLAHQLECLDVTDLAAEPVVAGQLKSFLRTLAEQCRTTSPRAADMLISAADSVRSGESPGGGPRRSATLIHTLERAAAAQMEELMRRHGDRTRTLTVLAPFHTKDGAAVRSLRQAVDASELRIAHLGTVACNPQAYGDAAYVVPHDRRSGQKLHAKVFEFETDDGVLVVSGSVNATRQSLQSTQNVEISLARWATVSPFEWQPCEPDEFAPHEQIFESRRIWTMEAVLMGSSRLEALVLGQGAALAHVEWILARASGEIARGSAPLDGNGLLRADLSAHVEAMHDGLTLHVHGPSGIEARAWVNDQRALRAVRNGVRLSGRVSVSEQVASDYRFATDLILRALGGQPIHGPVRVGGSRQAGPAQERAEALDEAFSYEDWLRSGRLRTTPGATLSRRTGAFLARVLDLLLPHPDSGAENGDVELNGIPLDDANPDDEDGERRQDQTSSPPGPRPARTPQAQAEREQLLKACQAVREAFEAGRETIPSAELLILAVCSLDMERAQQQFLTHATGEPGTFDGHRVLLLWLDCVSRERPVIPS